jgi:hypothetical protein
MLLHPGLFKVFSETVGPLELSDPEPLQVVLVE